MLSRVRTVLLALVMVAPLFAALPAQAGHVSVTVDGNLTDLEAAVAANAGSDKGGFACDDAKGDRYAGVCAFVNGFDMRRFLALFDYKNPDGSISPTMDLYLGFSQDGIIGDTDGDGNPDLTTPTSPGITLKCTTGEQTGIGGGEFYTVQFDTDCNGLYDNFSLGITNNQVAVIDPNTGSVLQVIPDGQFCFKSGNCASGTPLTTLEIFIPNIGRFFPQGTDPCNFKLIGFSGARNDGPGEDTSDQEFTFSVPPSLDVEKTPATQDACAGSEVPWTITVTNTGLCDIDQLKVTDVLDAGLSYVSADPAPSSVNGQTVIWNLGALAKGQSQIITLRAQLAAPCQAPVLNNTVTAEGTHFSDCLPPDGATSSDTDVATVNCLQPDVEITKLVDPPTIGPGEETTVTLTISNPGNSILDPINVCDLIDAGVSFNEAQVIGGTCGISLLGVTANPDGSKKLCFTPFDLNPGQSCTIIYKVGCAAVGVHNDLATAEGFCKGTTENPDTDEASGTFTCLCVPDVEIDKALSVSSGLKPGDKTMVTLTISNPGDDALTRIDVCDVIDAGTIFDAAQTIGGSCGVTLKGITDNPDGTKKLCFTPFELAAKASCTITYELECGESGLHTDISTATGYCTDDPAVEPDVDTDQASYDCQCLPEVDIEKSLNPTEVVQGGPVAVTLTIRNLSTTTTLKKIAVCDQLDAGVGFDQAQTIGGTCGVTVTSFASQKICFSEIAELAPGGQCTITYVITAPADCADGETHSDVASVKGYCEDTDVFDEDSDEATFTCNTPGCCWLTMGGFLNADSRSGNKDNTYGGNVGPPPSGSWQHIQRNGKEEVFNFHSHDAHVIACGDDGTAGPCHPAGDSNWINFGGTGYYSINGGPRVNDATFRARAEDHGEPGREGWQKGGCGTPDFYRIEVFDPSGALVFTVEGYVDGGNIQIHNCKHAKQTESSRGRSSGRLQTSGSGDLTPETGSVSSTLELYRPTPNPFTNATTIAYAVNQGEGADVQIGIYNVAGRLVRSLVSGFQSAGRHEAIWDGRSDDGSAVAQGVYFLRAFVGGERMTAASRILYMR